MTLGTVSEIGDIIVWVKLDNGVRVPLLRTEFEADPDGVMVDTRVEVDTRDIHPYLVRVVA